MSLSVLVSTVGLQETAVPGSTVTAVATVWLHVQGMSNTALQYMTDVKICMGHVSVSAADSL